MPALIQQEYQPVWKSNVGLRELPHSGVKYYARAPTKTSNKNGIFQTVWLPVNASNRVVVDRQQDLMHLKYISSQRKNKNLRIVSADAAKNNDRNSNSRQNSIHLNSFSHNNFNNSSAAGDNSKVKPIKSKKKSKQDSQSYLSNLKNSKIPISYDLTKTKLPKIELEPKPADYPEHVKIAMWKTNSNSMAPFASLGKPTCGYFFTRNIRHQKKLIGINPTNTVKWRSNVDIMNIKKDYKN